MRPVLVALVVAACVALLVPSRAPARVQFRLPLADPTPVWVEMLLHVDHDPEDQGQGNVFCLAHDCIENFPSCYDEHRGTDFVLEGGWEVMDQGTVQVVAAASGTVVRAVDGNYDRCHANLSTQQVDCDGHPMQANFVELRHADGTVTLYYHLKKGSVAVRAGDDVDCGDVLGLVGSSGNSSMPHVHFQVEDPSGGIIDPYSGPCSHADTWWVVEDAGNGLPGPWCQGQEIPEPAVESVESVETVDAVWTEGVAEVEDPAEFDEPAEVEDPAGIVDTGMTEGLAEATGPDETPDQVESEAPVEPIVESSHGAEDLPGEGTVSEGTSAEVTDPADPGESDRAPGDLDVLEPADPGAADTGAAEVAGEDTRGVLPLPGGFGCSSGAAPGDTGILWALVVGAVALLAGLRRRARGVSRES